MSRALLLLLGSLAAASSAEEICLSGDSDPYLYFGDKTAYIFATRGLPNFKTHDVPGCYPIAFWLLYRPGSHNPEASEIKGLQELAVLRDNFIRNYNLTDISEIDDRICSEDRKHLEQWSPQFNATFAGHITSDGSNRTNQSAQAWRGKYPGLLTNDTYNYLFKFPPEQLYRQTFRAFTEGLFGDQAKTVDILKDNDEKLSNFKFSSMQLYRQTFRAITEGLFWDQAETVDIPKDNDEKLSNPYKSCPVWTKEVEENEETEHQRNNFVNNTDYREMITRISRRLGFKYDIHRDVVHQMYQMCRYNKAWNFTQISPWCAVFTKEDLKRIEYAEDLQTFYKYGYGQPLHSKIGCLPVKDMYNFFTNHIAKELPQLPLSMVTLTSAPMLLATLATLGAAQDASPPTGDNFNFQPGGAQARKWTTSTLAPFNGNIAAVLYKCNPNGNFQVKDEYQVLFFENEKPMYLEGCRVGLCDWSLVKKKYGNLVTNCDLDFCDGADNINFRLSLALIGFVVSRCSAQM